VETDSLSWVVMPSLYPSPPQLSRLRAPSQIHKLFRGSLFKFDAPDIRLAYYRAGSAFSVFRRLLYCVIEPGPLSWISTRPADHDIWSWTKLWARTSMYDCKLANIGNKIGNTTYIERAKGLYSSLLRSFRLRISNEAIFTTVESLVTAALLGLYEVSSFPLHPNIVDRSWQSIADYHQYWGISLCTRGSCAWYFRHSY